MPEISTTSTTYSNSTLYSNLGSKGRLRIYSDADEITPFNVVDELKKAIIPHTINAGDIHTLFGYYKGNQPILKKVKIIRPEINNRVLENHAWEIVNFKTGYVFGEPIQYIVRGEEPQSTEDHTPISRAVDKFNDYMFLEDKSAKDTMLAEWCYICGIGFRFVEPNRNNIDNSYRPFLVDILDPRNTFVVYSNTIGNKPLMSAHMINEL